MAEASLGPSANGPNVGQTLPRIRVMVVDDNAGFRESLHELLDTERLVVVGEAETGTEALSLIQQLSPDVVLMDIRMPSMDGIETTRRLKELCPGTEVVALTGHEDQEAVREMLVAGAAGYMLKDADGEDILNAIMQAALGGAVLSPGITPAVIEELTDALERERRRTCELERAHAALVERSERTEDLVARLGHELRTPVTVVQGIAQTLSAGTASPEQQRDLLPRLVARATALARIVERFEIAFNDDLTEHVNVGVLAAEVAEAHERVSADTAGTLPTVFLNRHVARRILEELVDNALKFSTEDSPVTIHVRRARHRVEVRIIDKGCGVVEAERERIFEALEQSEPLNARTHQGPGLGLSLARAGARAMDGDVLLESTGPGGSTFVWKIPLSVEPAHVHVQ